MHTTAHGHASLCRNVHTDERLHESRSLLLQFGVALNVGVGVCYAVLQSLNLGVHTHLCGRQTRDAHLHFYEFHAALFLCHRSHLLHLAYGRLRKVLNAQLGYQTIHHILPNGSIFYLHTYQINTNRLQIYKIFYE